MYRLSPQEQKVLTLLVAEGLSNKDIGDRLYINENTAKNYISEIMYKWDCRSRTQIVIRYYQDLIDKMYHPYTNE